MNRAFIHQIPLLHKCPFLIGHYCQQIIPACFLAIYIVVFGRGQLGVELAVQ